MVDRDIRHTLHTEVLKEFHDDPESRVLDEFGICAGAVRVDIVVINGALHGYEIKSDQDTLTRLPNQVELYSRTLDYATLVVGEPHLSHARKMLPRWWGIILAKAGKDGTPFLTEKKRAKRNPSPDPFALVQLLWRQEAFLVLEAHGMAKGLANKPRKALWEALVKSFTLAELGWIVRQSLKVRSGWRERNDSSSSPTLPSGAVVLEQLV